MQDITQLYTTDEYISKNPTLHEEDTPWKLTKILPAIDVILEHFDKQIITLLDVGGGAGLILKAVAEHIESHGRKVRKMALDLSPGMLEVQRKNNPDAKALNEDIRSTSLLDRDVDIVLMIDVLEHVPNPRDAIHEISRISSYAVFSVPLDDCLVIRVLKSAQDHLENQYGHINRYNNISLLTSLNAKILYHAYLNGFDRRLETKAYDHTPLNKTAYKFGLMVAACLFRFSPTMAAKIFGDGVAVAVRYV